MAYTADTCASRLVATDEQAPLHRILGRIRTLNAEMIGTGHKLSEHADTLYGGSPIQGAGVSDRPSRCGLLGEIEDALDYVEETNRFVAEQANRNCGLG